jgi:hypothetical protein
MDASPITQALVLFVIVTATTRYVLAPLARAGDGIATLFGPQTHTLGWPRGVQEGDEPWAWRAPQQAALPNDRADDDQRPGPEVETEGRSGTFVVPVAPVEAIRMGVRPH